MDALLEMLPLLIPILVLDAVLAVVAAPAFLFLLAVPLLSLHPGMPAPSRFTSVSATASVYPAITVMKPFCQEQSQQ